MSLKLGNFQHFDTSEIVCRSIPHSFAAPHRSSPAPSADAKGRAQRRQEASRMPGMAAGRHGIDPRSISEVLKILIFQVSD